MRFAPAMILVLAFCATATADDQNDIVAGLVESFGIDRFDQVEAMRFTFNVAKADRRVARTWEWHPKTHRVMRRGTLDANDPAITFDRDELDANTPKHIRKLDHQFINDTFWLLLPWHLRGATDVTVESTGHVLAPLGKTIARRVIVTYPPDTGGYTPGDMYKLYINDNWRIEQWTYHKAGAEAPTLACFWVQDEKVGPLVLTTDFRNPDANFRLWFTGVSVRLAGSDQWVESTQVEHKCRTCP